MVLVPHHWQTQCPGGYKGGQGLRSSAPTGVRLLRVEIKIQFLNALYLLHTGPSCLLSYIHKCFTSVSHKVLYPYLLPFEMDINPNTSGSLQRLFGHFCWLCNFWCPAEISHDQFDLVLTRSVAMTLPFANSSLLFPKSNMEKLWQQHEQKDIGNNPLHSACMQDLVVQ